MIQCLSSIGVWSCCKVSGFNDRFGFGGWSDFSDFPSSFGLGIAAAVGEGNIVMKG